VGTALYFPAASSRSSVNGNLGSLGVAGQYWTSNINGIYSRIFNFVNGYINPGGDTYTRDSGSSVRCVVDEIMPSTSTIPVTSITTTTATSGGVISNIGASAITASGICWSTTTAPTVANSKTTDGPLTTGTFASNMTGLSSGTLYYVRAYATNNLGTSYGNQVSFNTTGLPGVTTVNIASIARSTTTSASSGGVILFDGGSAITAKGICWSTSVLPTIANSVTNDGTGTGTFTSAASGLTNNTVYYVRAYATNTTGTAYGNQVIVTTCGAMTTSGTFLAFACYNLGVTTTGDALTYDSGNNNGDLYQWGRYTDGHEKRTSATINTQATNSTATLPSTVIGKFIFGFNDFVNTENNTLWGDGTSNSINPVKTSSDPCPSGFKVPSQAQFNSIFRVGLGAPQSSATANTWTWTGSGFTVGTALYFPAASSRSSVNGNLGSLGVAGEYWTSNITGTTSNSRIFNFVNGWVNPGGNNAFRASGLSVRCVVE
jgi:uncharacterized protein (TIGR02145 family)